MATQHESLATQRLLSTWLTEADARVADDAPWEEIEQLPSAVFSLLLIALPLSLLLPVMVNFAGTAYGDRLIHGFTSPSWERLLTILVLELLTVVLMAGFAQLTARFFQTPITRQQAFLIITLGSIPLWLSSLALAVPSITFILIAGTAGITLAGYTIYWASRRLLGMTEESLATLFSGLVLVFGLPAWTGILAVVVVR